jgi:hypothetical protein
MPGAVGPPIADFEVIVTERIVADAACGMNSHETETLNQLVADLQRRDDDGWELLTAHRSVLVPTEVLHDPSGKPIRGRIVRHELTYRRSTKRRAWEYRIDALSDPTELMAERHVDGWLLVGCSRFGFEAITPGVDHEDLVHRTEDAVLFWKRRRKRVARRPSSSTGA